MSEQSGDRAPGAVLNDRDGRGEQFDGFVWRAGVGGIAGGLLGTVLYGIVATASSGWGVWLVLLYGVVFACMAASLVGFVAAVVGLGAARFGRTARARTTLLAVVGGLAAAAQIELLALVAGPMTATSPLTVVIALVSGALGGALLVRLRHRTLRQALRLRTPSAPAR